MRNVLNLRPCSDSGKISTSFWGWFGTKDEYLISSVQSIQSSRWALDLLVVMKYCLYHRFDCTKCWCGIWHSRALSEKCPIKRQTWARSILLDIDHIVYTQWVLSLQAKRWTPENFGEVILRISCSKEMVNKFRTCAGSGRNPESITWYRLFWSMTLVLDELTMGKHSSLLVDPDYL